MSSLSSRHLNSFNATTSVASYRERLRKISHAPAYLEVLREVKLHQSNEDNQQSLSVRFLQSLQVSTMNIITAVQHILYDIVSNLKKEPLNLDQMLGPEKRFLALETQFLCVLYIWKRLKCSKVALNGNLAWLGHNSSLRRLVDTYNHPLFHQAHPHLTDELVTQVITSAETLRELYPHLFSNVAQQINIQKWRNIYMVRRMLVLLSEHLLYHTPEHIPIANRLLALLLMASALAEDCVQQEASQWIVMGIVQPFVLVITRFRHHCWKKAVNINSARKIASLRVDWRDVGKLQVKQKPKRNKTCFFIIAICVFPLFVYAIVIGALVIRKFI